MIIEHNPEVTSAWILAWKLHCIITHCHFHHICMHAWYTQVTHYPCMHVYGLYAECCCGRAAKYSPSDSRCSYPSAGQWALGIDSGALCPLLPSWKPFCSCTSHSCPHLFLRGVLILHNTVFSLYIHAYILITMLAYIEFPCMHALYTNCTLFGLYFLLWYYSITACIQHLSDHTIHGF